MSEELHWKTVSETLAEVLKKLMQLEELLSETNMRIPCIDMTRED